ncbi:lipopolysaccharide transport periplasmic protein LptA [Massilia sp. TS11]|uniref:lipopolysaccharide transport periplasmic protein LptA n=1 Tax=Massilia sp. TS11 TaxID=2908003 RepID=UPI001EDBFE48|nr:lipopolysaccharide transport periplasmic protein LptA [Massilia sp. TS11]MCG2584957.1 lipopolysaccharide transport periplasmic protein LptA [Massilia sp. TS11]
MKTPILACLLTALALPALAEKADANKPIEIDANAYKGNALTQGVEYTGNVELTRGTLKVRAGRAVVKEDEQGYTYITLFADPGKLVSFRQKRDGGDLWMEGEAERIEYDDKSEVVKFFSRVKLRQLEGTRVTQESTGEHFTYSNRTEAFSMINDASGTTREGQPRVRTVSQPKVIKPAGKQ